MNFEKKYGLASDKYYNGQKITFEEFVLLGVPDALVPDNYGNSIVECPNKDRGCDGTLIIKESRNGYAPYIGCTSQACNFYTTFKKVKDKRKLTSQTNNE